MQIARQASTTNPVSTKTAAAIASTKAASCNFCDLNVDALHRQTFWPMKVGSLDHFDKRRVQDRWQRQIRCGLGRRVHHSFSDVERKSVLRLFISERLSIKPLGIRRSFSGKLRSGLNPLGEPGRYTVEPGVQLVVVV